MVPAARTTVQRKLSVPSRLITSLIYVSTARCDLSLEDFLGIMTVSQRNNQRFGITGLLVFNGTNFMQCLEGDKAATNDCLRKIGSDERHNGITILSHELRAKPEFSGWHMAGRYLPAEQCLGEASLAALLADEAVSEATRTLFQSFRSLGGLPQP